jgi:mRNA-degrading endonuclease RelE of RelBE toxin-antitoxin system
MTLTVYITESFEKEINKLSNFDKRIVKKLFQKLKQNPYLGDPIRYTFFREKRLREKRIYYLVYEEINCILMVAIGGKKTQQATIDQIIEDLPEFKRYIYSLSK